MILLNKWLMAAAAIGIVAMPAIAEPASHQTVQQTPQLPGRYCNAAEPLSVVWVPPSGGKPQCLLSGTSQEMVMSEDGRLAVVWANDSGTAEYLLVYDSGKLVAKRPLGAGGNHIVGWYRGAVVIDVDGKSRTIDVATGSETKFPGPEDTEAVRSLPSGDLFIRCAADGTVVELDARNGKRTTWSKNVSSTINWTVVSNRYVAIECNPKVKDTIDTTKPRLWIIDLETANDRIVDLGLMAGFASGRTADELILGVVDGSRLRVTALNLVSLKQTTVATIESGRLTQVVGLSVDCKWVLLNTGYAEVGPGYLSALELSTAKRVRLQENVYECVLSPLSNIR